MSAPLSKAPPPPPTAEQRAQRLKQKRLVISAVAGVVTLALCWEAYDYYAAAVQRAEEQVQDAQKSLSPGHYDQAIKQLDVALDIDPASWHAYLQRGLARQNLNQLEQALADFEHALALKPDAVEALTARAEVFRQKGDRERAIEELTKVIALKPDVTAYYSRGLAYAELDQHKLAIPDLTWAIDQQRDAPFAYFARAKSKRALGDEAGAQKDEQMARSFDRGIPR